MRRLKQLYVRLWGFYRGKSHKNCLILIDSSNSRVEILPGYEGTFQFGKNVSKKPGIVKLHLTGSQHGVANGPLGQGSKSR